MRGNDDPRRRVAQRPDCQNFPSPMQFMTYDLHEKQPSSVTDKRLHSKILKTKRRSFKKSFKFVQVLGAAKNIYKLMLGCKEQSINIT